MPRTTASVLPTNTSAALHAAVDAHRALALMEELDRRYRLAEVLSGLGDSQLAADDHAGAVAGWQRSYSAIFNIATGHEYATAPPQLSPAVCALARASRRSVAISG